MSIEMQTDSNHIERLSILDFLIERSRRYIEEDGLKGRVPTQIATQHVAALTQARAALADRACQIEAFSCAPTK